MASASWLGGQRTPDGGGDGDGVVVRGERLDARAAPDSRRRAARGGSRASRSGRPPACRGRCAHTCTCAMRPRRLPYRRAGSALLDVLWYVSSATPSGSPSGSASQRLLDGVEQAGLVPVERLDAELHPALGRVVQDGRAGSRATRRTTAGVRPASHPPGTADRGVGRTRDTGAPSRRHVDAVPQVVLGGADGRRGGGHEITSRRHDGNDHRRGQPVLVQQPPRPGRVPVAGLLHGSSTTSKPQPATRGSEPRQVAVVSGESQTQVFTPMANMGPSGGSWRRRHFPPSPPGTRAGPRSRTARSAAAACRAGGSRPGSLR